MLVSLQPVVLATAVATLLASRVAAIPKVTRTGRYLYQEDGTRFYIRGIAYQEQGEVVESDDNEFLEPSTFIDPLAIPAACTRDVEYLTQANINTIRVYSVNSTLNHDSCMKTFSDAGIYTIIDLALPLNGSIARDAPSWSTNLLNQYLNTIDVFSKYDNVLAYNVGNEVVLGDSTQLAPYVKAAARDVKAYLKSKSSDVLVGYAAINGASTWRNVLADYLSCGSDATAIDLYGLNDYSWCGDSSFQSSYAGTTSQFADYNVVAYFSEFGCISSPPRLWTEAAALLSSDMSSVWSGGIAFSYFPAASAAGQFGMVTVSTDGNTITTSSDWDRLVTQYGGVSPPNSPAQSSASASTYGTCPSATTDFLASNTLPPTPNESACNCLENALSCQFTPQTSNYSVVAGELINTGCSLLGESGGSCTEIGGDGQTGVYGRLSGCDPIVKLSFVMSSYYEANGKQATACDFAGNGTVNAASQASAAPAASSCIASPSATFVPSAPATTAGGSASTSTRASGGSNGNGGSSSGNGNGAASTNALAGIAIMGVVALASAAWTLV
ncbi:glycoside hydrolase family 72 protein [Coprinellus micaceus]|uniref:1,3-beta-glucanosyltransferase n=1 Tax=Coprinellus micaceus TaxID=71717 RepID=A0A4Y7TY07_COPMI|nr:glycoside hydrolase family 72 protein [Coprinellus micaceus]